MIRYFYSLINSSLLKIDSKKGNTLINLETKEIKSADFLNKKNWGEISEGTFKDLLRIKKINENG